MLQDLGNMVDGVEQTSRNTIFFPRDSGWRWPCFMEKLKRSSNWRVQVVFMQKIFIDTLQLSSVNVCIVCLIAV